MSSLHQKWLSSVILLISGNEELKEALNPSGLILEALLKIADDPALSLVPGSPGYHKQQMANLLLKQPWDREPLQTCATVIVHTLLEAFMQGRRQNFSSSGALTMLSELNVSAIQLRSSFLETLHWPLESRDSNEQALNNTLQHLIELLLPVIADRIRKQTTQDSSPAVQYSSDLPEDEKQVLHFVIGYTARALR